MRASTVWRPFAYQKQRDARRRKSYKSMTNVCDAPHCFTFPACNLWAIGNVHIVADVIFSCEFIIRSMRISRQIDVKSWYEREMRAKRPNCAPHDYMHYNVARVAIILADNTRYYSEPRNMYVRIRQVCISLRWAKSRIPRLQTVVAHSDITRGTINRLTRRNPVYFADISPRKQYDSIAVSLNAPTLLEHEYFTGLFE